MDLKEFSRWARGGLWTDAFQEAMNALTSQGGGTLHVPAGRYETAPVQLQSNTTLHLQEGAEIVFTDDETLFPLVDTEFEGIAGKACMPCLYARNVQTVRVTGTGTINGSGAAWWDKQKSGTLRYPRPYLVCFQNCVNVEMSGVTLKNSPCWTVHPLYCENVTLSGLKIYNPADSPNTDGINPNSSRNVIIEDCLIDVGDDCIAIKAGTEDTPQKRSCENISVTGCRMMHGHGGVVIGSEMSGCVKNVKVVDCVFTGTDRGIRLKTRRGRGGRMSRLYFSDILMTDVACPFVINMYYFCGKGGKLPHIADKGAMPVDAGTPRVSEVMLKNITVRGATASAGYFYGLPESPIQRVRMMDCTVTMAEGRPGLPAMMDGMDEMEAAGLFLRHCINMDILGLRIENQRGDRLNTDDSVEMIITEGNR